jgi:preprotein translocase subunit YajC
VVIGNIAMPDWFAPIPLLFAQNAPAAGAASPSVWTSLLPLLPIPILFYFLMIRPQQQQERKRREMIDALKKNDKVLTAAGIYGTVVAIDHDHDRVVLRVDDDRGVKLTFSKSSVARVLELSPEKTAEPTEKALRD